MRKVLSITKISRKRGIIAATAISAVLVAGGATIAVAATNDSTSITGSIAAPEGTDDEQGEGSDGGEGDADESQGNQEAPAANQKNDQEGATSSN